MKLKTAVLISMLLPIAAMANPITVVMEAGSGVSDGVNQVLPYTLSLDGVNTLADCYDFLDPVSLGETWQANILTLGQVETSGRFSGQAGSMMGYELIGVLSSLASPTAQDQIDLQHALWNVFDPFRFAVTPGVLAYDVEALTDLAGFDFSKVSYIEPVKGYQVQTFVIPYTGSGVPEPGTMLLLGAGLLAMGIRRRIR